MYMIRYTCHIDDPDHVVLAIIQEKVNNPTPDDPFEPDVAAVKNDCLV
jgi:hypothetical protein